MSTASRIARVCVPLAPVHSALASRQAKELAARLAGTRRRNGLYRVVYVGQSLATFAWLYHWLRGLPDRPLYDLPPPLAWIARGGQAVAVAAGFQTAWQVGVPDFNGITQLQAFLAGGDVEPEPEAQGPILGGDGEMVAAGPFAVVRHPANLTAGVVLLLDPRMTERKLVVGLLATAYGWVGSLYEERRLLRRYGDAYERYRRRVSFFLPGHGHRDAGTTW